MFEKCPPAISALLLMAQALHAAEPERPNIVFIMSDDHANKAISAYGSDLIETPHLDRLASEGMLFNNAFCTNSICGPSRAVILTGKYSHLNGFLVNETTRFDGAQTTFPKLFQKAGYETAVIGKWHLGEHMPPQGYDYSEVLIGQGPYYNPPMITQGEKGEPVTRPHTGYTTDIIADKTLAWLKQDRDPDKPFMVMCQHKAPHRNWMPGPKYLNWLDDVTIPEPETLWDNYSGRTRSAARQTMTIKQHLNERDLKLTGYGTMNDEQKKVWDAAYGPKNEAYLKARPNMSEKEIVQWKYQRYVKDYLRCVKSVDDCVGRVLDYLDESGLAENTVVIYSSDQGWYLGEHGWFDKRWMYEESLKTPLMVRWPGHVEPGSTNDDIVSNLDFAETFLDIAGVDIPRDMQGLSLKPLFAGNPPADWRESLYYHYYEFHGNRKTAHMVRRHYGVRTSRYKLIHFYNLDEWELFDLEKDPREMKSVYSDPAYASIAKELADEAKRLQEVYQVPDDQGSVPKAPPSLKPGFKNPRRQPQKKPQNKKQ